MFSNILAQHVPYIPGFGSETAGPVPSPPPSPAPPQDEPIAFSAVVRDSLFGIVSSAISSTTLATITCADASMTITTSQTVAGLTFSYSGNVLSVSGTPTASGFTRVVVSYISSDGNRTVRGSTSHEISIVDATEVVTIDTTYPVPQGRKGFPYETTICDLSANYSASIRASVVGVMTGLSVSLTWERGASSGSGSLEVSGTPASSGTGSFSAFFVDNETSQTKAAISFQVVVQPSYTAVSPAPPAPPAPSPTPIAPPPAPTPAPAPGTGPDPMLTNTRVLMRFNSATGIATDERGNAFVSSGPTLVTGAVAEAARFNAASDAITGTVPTLVISDADDEHLTVEAMVKPNDNALWVAVYSDGVRYMPVVSCAEPDGTLIWTLGYVSLIDNSTPENPSRNVHPCLIVSTASTSLEVGGVTMRNYRVMSLGRPIPSQPGKPMHVAGMLKHDAPSKLACWGDGKGQFGIGCATFTGTLQRPTAAAVVRIGSAFVQNPGAVIDPQGNVVQIRTMVGAKFDIDEFRIKQADHYSAYITGTNTQADIPATARVIPWPNY